MFSEEYQIRVWKAGEVVSAGTYARIDDTSYHIVQIDQDGPLPATFDGHIAVYCAAARGYRPTTYVNQPEATEMAEKSGFSTALA